MASACDQSYGIERSADHVIRIPPPEDPPIACIRVQAGDTVILPFDLTDYPDLQIGGVDGFLVIQGDGTTVLLQGFANTFDDGGYQTVTVAASSGRVIDVATVFAATDPNMDINASTLPPW